ncbi:MAG: M81 family metallopeptidase [Thermomicrobiales bacterium]|nr:M81 family metallopeptidase [Thermomicrobiales bacterium]
MRFIAGGIMHETHTFSSEPTPLERFRIWRGDEVLTFRGKNHSFGGALDACAALGIDYVPTFFADTLSTAAPDRATFDAMTGELCDRIETALPADGIVLNLHGAMVAEGFPDAEAEIVRRVRTIVGAQMPIAVTLDFHANIGREMVEQATIVTTYDTYPHTDAAERSAEAVELLRRTVLGKIDPVLTLEKPPLLLVPQAMPTGEGPFQQVFAHAHSLEDSGAALSITIAGGFSYSDVPMAGVSVLVTTDGDPVRGQAIATELATELWELRTQMTFANLPVDEAVRQAIAFEDGPVMLVDVGDNIGGGTTGDGTSLLDELLRQQATDAVIVISDPDAAAQAVAVGVGGRFDGLVGGKIDILHGDPVRVQGTVAVVSDGRWVHEGPENAGVPVESGPTAVVRAGGVSIVLTSTKIAPGDQQQLKSVGLDPAKQKIIVVKAAVRWRGGYEPIARHVLYVDTPGLGSTDLSRFDFRNLGRPLYPMDPGASFGHR